MENGVTIVTDYLGRNSGEAFVQFSSPAAAHEALQRDREMMGNRWGAPPETGSPWCVWIPSVSFLVCSSSFAVCICRYVEVFPSRSEDIYSRRKTRNSSHPQLNRTASQTSLKTSEGILRIVLSLFVVIVRCWDVYSGTNWHICSIRVP